MDISRLLEIARQFRTVIEHIPVERRPIGMQQFPRGACGDASLLLGAYLADLGIEGFQYICGERGSMSDDSWTSHAWLQLGECVIDITADQFADAPAGVIVSESSEWHRQFETEKPSPSDFRVWNGFGADILLPFYKQITNQIRFRQAGIGS
jgi:hypothetical protein